MAWTIEEAWNDSGREKITPDKVTDADVTEADRYLAAAAEQAMAEPDTGKRAKIMHAAVAYCLPFLTDMPAARDAKGELIGGLEEGRYVSKHATSIYIEHMKEIGGRPSPKVLRALATMNLDGLTTDQWFDLYDALGRSGECTDRLLRKFYKFADARWTYCKASESMSRP